MSDRSAQAPHTLAIPRKFFPTKPVATAEIPRPQGNEHYLRGPIPLRWLEIAANLPGRSLHVANAIWYRAGLESNGTIRLGNAVLNKFGVKPDAKRRALNALEGAGLIKVQREDNKNPLVTILPVPSQKT